MSSKNRSSGTARRDPQRTEPDRAGSDRTDGASADDTRRTAGALERERERGAVDTVHDAGRQPGAFGNDTPHRNVKPGTRRSIEEADPQRG